jgi:hypothetical protein
MIPSRIRRSRALVALALAIATIAACDGSASSSPSAPIVSAPPASVAATPAPTVAATPEPTTAPAVTPATGSGECAPDDLRVDGGPWEASAGSRFAELTVTNQGDAACALPAQPSVAVADATGSVLVATDQAGAAAGPSLATGGTARFSVQFANWCDSATAMPARVLFLIAGGGIDVANLALPTADDMPPCNGPDQPPSLSATEWSTG